MTRRAPVWIVLAAGACGTPAKQAVSPAASASSATKLQPLGTRDAFCATTIREGCTRTCVQPPTPWSGASATFSHAELWAHVDHCADDIVEATHCTLAVEHGGEWYAAFDERCKQAAGPATTTGLAMDPVVSRGGLVVFAYTVTGTLDSSDDRGGERVDTSNETVRRSIVACGVGTSGVPSCLEPILVAGNGVGGDYVERRWDVDEQGVIAIGGFPEGSEPAIGVDETTATRFAVTLP